MIRKETIEWCKSSGNTYYLGKPMWLKLVSNAMRESLSKEVLSKMDLDKKVKKYKLHESGTDKSIATVTLGDVQKLKNAGIKVYAEKDGVLV